MTNSTTITPEAISKMMPQDIYTAVKLLGYTTRDGKDIDKNIIDESIAKGLNEYYNAVDSSYEVDDAGNKTLFSEKLLRNMYPGMYAANVVEVEKRKSFSFLKSVIEGDVNDFKIKHHISLDRLILESLVLSRLNEPSSHGYSASYFVKMILENVERDSDVRPELAVLFSILNNGTQLTVIDISDFLNFITKLSVSRQKMFCEVMRNYHKRDLLTQYNSMDVELLWYIVNKHHSLFDESVVKEYMGFVFNIKYIAENNYDENPLKKDYQQKYEDNIKTLIAEYEEKLTRTVHESDNVFLRKRAEFSDSIIEKL